MRLSFSVLFVTLFSLACQPSSPTLIDISPEISIADIHAAYEAGTYSAQDLTQYYLDRIESLNPKLHAVITLNPDALAIAAALDEKRASDASLGPLHGIPVLLKDNIDTHDSMPCTAGANSMAESYPLADSPLAAQLRAAGAIILGKANLSEWANFHSSTSSSGWSALGGQTRNPYDLSRNPCGSSSGSGAAVSANLCVIAIGTETNGSIVCPANNNGVVGIKPTVGLISRRGIIPISYSQDTGGPMARSVEDAVRTLGTLTAPDSLDDKTTAEGRQALTDYTPFLKQEGIAGKRIGYFKAPLGDHVRITAVMEAAVEVFRQQGAEIIEIEEPILKRTGNHSFQVLLYEFKDGLNKYFASLGPNAKVKSLEELIEKTFSDSVEMHYHDHAILKQAQEKGDLNSEEYQEALATVQRQSRAEGIDKVMDELGLDAIIAPTGGPAWKTDLTNGDNFGGVFSSSPAAISGYPNITVPMGQIDSLPLGISIFGRAWSEPTLIEIAYGFEQASQHRLTPQLIDFSLE